MESRQDSPLRGPAADLLKRLAQALRTVTTRSIRVNREVDLVRQLELDIAHECDELLA